MRRLLAVLVARPVGVSLALVALAALGLVALWRLPLAAMPALDRPVVRVEADLADRSLLELETELAPVLEERLLSVAGIDALTTWCLDGAIAAEAAFRWGTDPERDRLAVAEAVEGLGSSGESVVFRVIAVDPRNRPALILLVEGDTPLDQRTAIAEDLLLPRLAALAGVGRVEVLGGVRRRTVVRPDPARLRAAGLDLAAVRGALASGVRNEPIGEVLHDSMPVDIFVEGSGDRPGRVARLAIPLAGTASIPLGELASVTVEPWPEHGVLRVAGRAAVGLAIHLARGANAIATGRDVERTLAELTPKLPAGATLSTVVDEPRELRRALAALALAAAVGALMAGAVLAALLRRPGPLVVLFATIPLSLAAALPVFELLGLDLNLVSLAGIALVMGMLVDASVVVLDAGLGRPETSGPERAVAGTAEVARAIIASAVTTAVVFVPALYLRHLAAALFRQLAVAIMVTLLASLALALLVLPTAAARLAPASDRSPAASVRAYGRLLTRLLSRPAWTLPVLVAALAGSVLLVRALPQRLLPPETASGTEIRFALPPQTRGPVLFRLAERLAAVTRPLVAAGASDLLALGQPPYAGPPLVQGFWRLPGQRRAEPSRPLGEVLEVNVDGLVVLRAGPVGGVLDALPLRPLAVDLSGPSRPRVEAEAGRVADRLRAAGLETTTDLPATAPRVELAWTARGARLGPANIERAIAGALPSPRPPELGRVRLDEPAPSVGDLEGLPIALGQGLTQPLGALTRIAVADRSPVRVRHRGEPAVRLLLGGATAEVGVVERAVATAAAGLPSDVALTTSGGVLDWQEARTELELAAALGLTLVFLVLAALYESFRLPVAVFAVLPFAALGGAAGLALGGHGLDLASGLGFVLLGGLAVNNGVLLVDRLQAARGGPEAWARRASVRLRPVLVTTLTTLATLAPVAFLGGTGASLRSTLALTVFSGLLVSTPAALFVVPPLARLVLAGSGLDGRGGTDAHGRRPEVRA